MQRCLLFACIAFAWAGASAHTIADDVGSSNATHQKPATHGAFGRFAFVPYGESLVLRDAATGRTWILKRDGNSEKPCWSTIGDSSEPSNFTERTGPNITVVALKSLDPTDTAAILTEVYKETPDIIVEALPKMKCIAIQADENTTKGIRELLSRL